MGIKINRGLLFICIAALMLTGCKSSGPDEISGDANNINGNDQVANLHDDVSETQPPALPRQPQIRSEGGIIIFHTDGGSGANDVSSSETLRGRFYFDFDQAIVKRIGHAELKKHAQVLKAYRNYRVRLEGHADERGTREYNLALGERRANAIRSYLVVQGASQSQIEVVSYGEEKPIAIGSEESAWAQNRRVEIKYRN